MKKKIGIIGLGEMGLPMALNLQKSGFQVLAYDVNQSNYGMLQEKGVACCNSIKEVAEEAEDSIISIVRNLQQTEEVIFGEEGIVNTEGKGLSIIVMSTLDPSNVKNLETRAESNGLHLVDAPVSGGKIGAEAATLTIMTAGKKSIVEKCNPYFETLGKNIFYFGENCGSGQVAKLTNNLVLAINIAGLTEGLRFAKKNNLSVEETLKLLNVSSGNSWVVNNWYEEVKNYKPDATLGVIHKDLLAVTIESLKEQFSLPLVSNTFNFLTNEMNGSNKPVEDWVER